VEPQKEKPPENRVAILYFYFLSIFWRTSAPFVTAAVTGKVIAG
jgi:hypothetical protein